MNSIIQLLCLAGLFAVTIAGPAPPPEPNFKFGRYAGSCVQLAATSADGASSYCVDKGSVVTYPFYASWKRSLKPSLQYTYQYSQDGVNITTFANKTKTWANAPYVSSSAPVNITTASKPAFCMTAHFPEGTSTFRAYTELVGKSWVYVEEGVYYTGNNSAVSYGCEKAANAKLFCNADTYSYRCISYLNLA